MNETRPPEAVFTEQTMPVLRWLGDQIPGGFFIYRADGPQELLYVNRETLRIFGCATVEEFRALTGYTFQGLVHPEDYPSIQASIDQQIADETNENLDYVEYRVVRKDGEVRWVDDYGHFAQMPGYGDVYYVFISDITEKRAVREENRRRAEVIEGLSRDYASIYLLELETGGILPYRLSKGYFRKIVADLEERGRTEPDWKAVLDVYAERYVVPEDRERYRREIDEERIRERLRKEHSYTVDYRRFGNEGEVLYSQMSIVSIQRDGKQHAVMGYRDVNEQVLKVQRETAERLKTEMDLEREKHANEIKSAFLFNMSHDIRTPMNAIVGFSGLAKRHIREPERLTDYLDKVDESSRQLMALIDDMLEMSRIDYGRVELKDEPADLREQLDMVTDLFRAPAEERRLTLIEKIELADTRVLIDDHRFRRIMGNLISNAVKFTPDGGTVTISARQKQVSESGFARFEFSVSDTGVGMTEDFMGRMYEAFEREESSTRTGMVGTGLGLAITKNLLDIMGGSISVKSRKGEGSTFTVDLPLKLADHAAAPEETLAEPSDHRAKGEYRVLLAEDIEINRALAETILEDAGFLVESVPDGCDAVEAIRNRPLWYYDLVLMDIQMPVMNGYEATRAIRALRRADTVDLPIIALSANAREDDKRMSMDSGMDNHVAKPFDVANLIQTVNRHIAERNRQT